MNEPRDTPIVTWSPPDVDRVVTTVVKHRRLILMTTVLALAAVLPALWLLPARYEVTARVLFRLGREMATPPTVGGSSGVVLGKRPEDITSEIEIMRGQALIEELVADLGPEFFLARPAAMSLAQRLKAGIRAAIGAVRSGAREVLVRVGLAKRLTPEERLVLALERGIAIEAIPRSDVVRVTMLSPDPEVGVAILDRFLDLYLERHIAAYKTPMAAGFFAEKAAELRDKLALAEQAMVEHKTRSRVWSVDGERALLLERWRDLAAARAETAVRLSRGRAEAQVLESQFDSVPRDLRKTEVVPNASVAALEARLGDLKTQRGRLQVHYQDSSRTLRDLTSEITEIERALAEEPAFVARSYSAGLQGETVQLVERELVAKQTEVGGLEAQAGAQALELERLDQELVRLEQADGEFRRLERERALLEQQYSLYANSLEEARIQEAMDLARIANVSVIAPPTASIGPVWPPKRLWLIGALVLGLGGSILAAFLLEAQRPTAHSAAEVLETLGAPVLAEIPESSRP